MKENLQYRLSAQELKTILPQKAHNLIQILDLLYRYPQGLTRLEIQENLFKSGASEQKNVQNWVKTLLEYEAIMPVTKGHTTTTVDESGRNTRFTLSNQEMHNTTIKYSTAELKNLSEWSDLIETYNYIPFLKDLQTVIDLSVGKNITPPRFIDFEKFKYIGSSELMADLYSAIKNRRKISFTYQHKYEQKKPNLVKNFMPHLLKEHKKRWYVVGKASPDTAWKIYGLDRISVDKKINVQHNSPPFVRIPIKPGSLWKNSSGIYTTWIESDKKDDSSASASNQPKQISFKVKDGSKYDNITYLKCIPRTNHTLQTS